MKIRVLGCTLFILVAASLSVRAAEQDWPKGHNPFRKLTRGFANVLYGIVEMPNQVTKVNAEYGGGAAATYGVGKGFVRWISRELVGVYEIVTFPIPLPRKYQPIMQPEFPIEDYEP